METKVRGGGGVEYWTSMLNLTFGTTRKADFSVYLPAVIYPPKNSFVFTSVTVFVDPWGTKCWAERLSRSKISNDSIGNTTRNFPSFDAVPQPSAPAVYLYLHKCSWKQCYVTGILTTRIYSTIFKIKHKLYVVLGLALSPHQKKILGVQLLKLALGSC